MTVLNTSSLSTSPARLINLPLPPLPRRPPDGAPPDAAQRPQGASRGLRQVPASVLHHGQHPSARGGVGGAGHAGVSGAGWCRGR